MGNHATITGCLTVGYFSPAVVSSKESPAALADAQLAKRWGGIIESALSHAGKPDVNGMALSESAKQAMSKTKGPEAGDGGVAMDIDDGNTEGVTTDPDTDGTSESMPHVPERKLLPFASRLLPTGTGRGNELCEMNAQKLQKALKPALTAGQGVLGDVCFFSGYALFW